MVHKSLFVIFIILISSHFSQQQQNLCGTDGTRTWVNDPSSCHAYLWCNWNLAESPPTLTSVHQLDCRDQGSNHFRPDAAGTGGVCTEDFAECVADPLTMCPPAGENEILIANPDDPTCREHRPCRLTSAPMNSCREPLVFNRNSGTCDFVDRAPCNPPGGSTPPSLCPAEGTANVPGSTCYTFILCINGVESGTFTCGPNLHFDQDAGQCVEDTNGSCIRSVNIQRVKTVKTLTGFNRFLRAVHLY